MNSSTSETVQPIWSASEARIRASTIDAFARYVQSHYNVDTSSYALLWRWSVDHLSDFWESIWHFFQIEGTSYTRVLIDSKMPGAKWFEGAKLNYTAHALRTARTNADGAALLCISEAGHRRELSWSQLTAEVARIAEWLRATGVVPGDRVVGYLPNQEHATIAFLAAASLGAVWSSCAPDYGAKAALDRFAQLEPTILFAASNYSWAGKTHDRRGELAEIIKSLPTLRATVLVSPPLPDDDLYIQPSIHNSLDTNQSAIAPLHRWSDLPPAKSPLECTALPFDHPLWILFSSGTTGVPKGIVHGHGGVLLEELKLLGLQADVHAGDQFTWFTSTNWVMWNILVSGLLLGATVLLIDGSPTFGSVERLFQIAAKERLDFLGMSPGYLRAVEGKAEPGRDLDLSALRSIGVTGAPVPASSYLWVRDHVGSAIQLASLSGGTDVASGLAGGAVNTPVYPGEIAGACLGVSLEAWDPNGRAVREEVAELVITRPMPSMPIYFWNDREGLRYQDAYFAMFDGIWRHGDWVTVTARDTIVIHGRSDSTLNRHGVRIGSADIYSVVEKIPGVQEALVIGAELPDGGYWMPLFLVLAEGISLDETLRVQIRESIRRQASPRHVPDEILAIRAVPHTRTGKKLEVPIKRILQGAKPESVVARSAVDDFAMLDWFEELARERSERAAKSTS